MSSVTSLTNNNYYQLSDPSAGAGGGADTSNSTALLLQALSASTTGGATSSSASSFGSDFLDLSPTALQSLNGTTGSGSSASASFNLTEKQQQTIATILAKYKDAPFTQATFDSIQNDLQAAGLDPATLSKIDEAQSFNPTQLLIDDLDGNYSGATALTQPNETAKSANYMQNIISEWKNMEGSNATASSASATDSTASGAA